MTSRDFAYWLMGSLELTPTDKGLDKNQTEILKNHLNMVFVHEITPEGDLKQEIGKSTTSVHDIPSVNC